jgi:hypothetical protein
MARLTVNGQAFDVSADPNTPLLWVLREEIGLTGTKYGCGIAECGSCTVHIDGEAVRSCSVAEQLECDWSKVTTEYPTPRQNLARNRIWGDYLTAGSRGIRTSHEYVRKAGAAARQMLVEAAAKEWAVPPSEISAAKSVLRHEASGRSARYGEFAARAAQIEPPKEVTLKDPKEWRLIGQSIPRLDTAAKVNGSLIYGIDLKLPGMLNAAIRDCPVFGGKLVSFDAAKIASMSGIRHVVRVGDTAVAVIADRWWQANAALNALGAQNVGRQAFDRLRVRGGNHGAQPKNYQHHECQGLLRTFLHLDPPLWIGMEGELYSACARPWDWIPTGGIAVHFRVELLGGPGKRELSSVQRSVRRSELGSLLAVQWSRAPRRYADQSLLLVLCEYALLHEPRDAERP